ncbi:hypothetical protein [Nocardia sp. NBC_01009]|nr:hypothetical protein OHA42_23610 [Nocardia sp. NBC_01009]
MPVYLDALVVGIVVLGVLPLRAALWAGLAVSALAGAYQFLRRGFRPHV